MVNKIINIREKYNWKGVFEIVRYKNADTKDRVYMFLMLLWYIPVRIVLEVIWVILYIPSKIFNLVDDNIRDR